ncbi:MAG: type II secretion system F family protein [Candidatus Dojkabacteria bacterium]|nr:type II secretion system F family protein [Candidatus Dojkabacteria bacterium]
MKTFKYSARTEEGKEVKGTISARDEAAVTEILHDKGLVIVNIKDTFNFNIESLNEINIGGIPLKDKVVFMRQMATMVSAGLPLTRALEIMEAQATNPLFRKVIGGVKERVESGQGLADSFRAEEDVFDDITLNLIEAGESSGKLDTILLKLAVELEEKQELKSKLTSALIYPVIITVVIIAVIALLMFVMVPAMSEIYSEFDAELPWTTNILISLSNFVTVYWWAVLLVLGLLAIGIKAYLDTNKGKKFADKIVLYIPIVKDVVTKTQIAEFTRIMSLLLSSGLSILQALELAAKSLSNSLFSDVIMDARDEVEKGGSLTVPISRSKYYPPIVSSMIAVGEETGNLDTVLEKVATYYKQEVNTATENLSGVLEPVFLIVMGATIGFIALAVYMPMFQLSSVMT